MSFGSPAADYVEPKLDLNRLLAPTPCQLIFCVWTPTASLPKESKKATFW